MITLFDAKIDLNSIIKRSFDPRLFVGPSHYRSGMCCNWPITFPRIG